MTDEYIYGGHWGGDLARSYLVRFRVTKRTAKRIYYQRPGERIDQHGNPCAEATVRDRRPAPGRKPASAQSTGGNSRCAGASSTSAVSAARGACTPIWPT